MNNEISKIFQKQQAQIDLLQGALISLLATNIKPSTERLFNNGLDLFTDFLLAHSLTDTQKDETYLSEIKLQRQKINMYLEKMRDIDSSDQSAGRSDLG